MANLLFKKNRLRAAIVIFKDVFKKKWTVIPITVHSITIPVTVIVNIVRKEVNV